MPRQRLRVVTESDANVPNVPKLPPKSLVKAAQDGDDIAELKAMRLRLAEAISDPGTPPRDLSSLSRRQIEIGREIRSLEALLRQEGDGDDGPADDEELDASSL